MLYQGLFDLFDVYLQLQILNSFAGQLHQQIALIFIVNFLDVFNDVSQIGPFEFAFQYSSTYRVCIIYQMSSYYRSRNHFRTIQYFFNSRDP